MKSREFLKELAEFNAKLRRDIEAFQIGLDASAEAIKERRRRVLSGDFTFFAYTYFPHHIRGVPSSFQAHFCTRFPQLLTTPGGVSEWWIAPRGEAKSSLLTKIGPVWIAVQALLQRPEIREEVHLTSIPDFIDYVILLGAETSLPTKLLEVSKTELTSNAALALDFPEVCGKGSTWKVGEFVTRTGVKVEPFGAEQAIRGTFHGASRPKVLLGDDLITDAEAKSPTERENRWNWLGKAIDYLGPPDGSVKYLGVGTILDKDDPISRAKRTIGHIVHHFRALEALPQNMDMWEQCEAIMLNEDKPAEETASRAGRKLSENERPSYLFYLANRASMDVGAITSWPAVRSLYWLMTQRAKNKRAFNTEMQGDPRNDEDKIFSHITFWVKRLDDWIMFGACDPSMGKGEHSDPSAILAGGWDTRTQKLHVIEAEIKRRVPSKLESDIIAFQREFNFQAFGFENNGAFEHSRQTFIKAGLAQGIALPLVGITTTVPLEVRVDSLEPFVCDKFSPSIVFSASVKALLAEMDEWPEPQPHHHFDGLSTLHILYMLAVSRGRSIGEGYTPVKPGNHSSDDDNNDMGFGNIAGAW